MRNENRTEIGKNTHFDSSDFDSNISKKRSRDVSKKRLLDPNILPTHTEIIEAFGPDAAFSPEWRNFLQDKERPVYEFLNEEFLDTLSDYLATRVTTFSGSKRSPITILEVCSGDGRLAHFLDLKLKAKIPNLTKTVATDKGHAKSKSFFPVEKLNHKDALIEHNPKIVICSWMPSGLDLSKDFRTTKSVDEYILVGDPLLCGEEWDTYGKNPTSDQGKIPPYLKDGFELTPLEDISKNQICCSDSANKYEHSKTFSFRRVI
jgi:hypothetical protein